MSATQSIPVIGTIGATSTDKFRDSVNNPVEILPEPSTLTNFVTGGTGRKAGENIPNLFSGVFGKAKILIGIVIALLIIFVVGQAFTVRANI